MLEGQGEGLEREDQSVSHGGSGCAGAVEGEPGTLASETLVRVGRVRTGHVGDHRRAQRARGKTSCCICKMIVGLCLSDCVQQQSRGLGGELSLRVGLGLSTHGKGG